MVKKRVYYCKKCGKKVVEAAKEFFLTYRFGYTCSCGKEGDYKTGKFKEKEVKNEKESVDGKDMEGKEIKAKV